MGLIFFYGRFLYLIYNFSILNFFYFNRYILKNNFIIFNTLLKNRCHFFGISFLINPKIFKYSWTKNKTNLLQFFITNFSNNLKLNRNYKINSNSSNLNDIIIFKKKSSIFKKNIDFEYTILSKSNTNKNDFIYKNDDFNSKKIKSAFTNNKTKNYSSFKNLTFNKNNLTEKNFKFNFKNLDFKKKINVVLKNNRIILRKFLKVKFKRQFSFNKYIKNLIKNNVFDFLANFEYNIINIITRSNFFFNKQDSIWFLKNGYISLNGFVTFNSNVVLKPLEVVNISYSNYYYYYYRKSLNDCLNNMYRINSKIWKINQKRIDNYDKKNESYSNWTYRFMYFKEDVPKFIEVDYLSMTLVILNYSINKNYLDFYNLKFLNLYLSRLYNWKYII